MRIPLDYYRILGVPIKATAEQINQAYQDRLMQMPLRQYSDRAIASRQALIERAYQILSVDQQRAEYDLKFLESSYPSTPPDLEDLSLDEAEQEATLRDETHHVYEEVASTPTIEIASEHIMGALLILQDLGEYEQVLQLGEVYLNEISSIASTKNYTESDNLPLKEDLLLTLALAYVELSREQWQKGEYENAALSGKMGLDLLAEENIFPSVREEIETDLCKLRPYRILELLARTQTNSVERATGFQLLQEMLRERGGIEGNGRDRSGLKCDQFLCFIQQLRNYLTAAEQQELFEEEAKRPSAVAAYITIYALMARGFADKEPALIYRAQQFIQSLIISHDVYWEQAVCALLLGQVQIANEALLKSKEKEKIDLVKQHAHNAADLLPGLCSYGEQWLQKEVLSQFSELASRGVTLREYFADPQVQVYLEQLPTMSAEVTDSIPETNSIGDRTKRQGFLGLGKKSTASTTVNYQESGINDNLVSINTKTSNTSVATLEPHGKSQVASLKPKVANGAKSPPKPDYRGKKSDHSGRRLPKSPPRSVKKLNRRAFLPILKGGILIIGLVFGVGSLGFLLTKILLSPSVKQASNVETEYLAISLNKSLLELPSVAQQPPKPKPEPEKGLTNTVAQQVVQQWLNSKSAAFGKEHKIDQLNSILIDPLLSQWRDRATIYQKDNFYRTYQHTVKIQSVKFDPKNPNQGSIEAEVREIAQHYQNQQIDPSQSYDDSLLVRYELVRQAEKWLIKNIDVLKTL
ncbi:heat shock protein DnaJ domain protein [Stanieria cyanosphaera PCC 7437]|uniref:Heat shock protein DnaJ domain protein n=1 Tax=Stanieria cyanosphaera (strain ATCC 29371 / PCC 7437) TaxID=111780 RepID=K9XYQ6_STAC7|nr:IMS domain-containing protein [Stanieria cyanosphaera]AFZ37261.1 heat shock protein DnaJ domain protein [Stanieria cyanosphaera PCC 7437]